MAKACQEITVQAVSFLERRGPVFYASLPVAPETLKGCRTNGAGDQHRLVSSLWDHLAAAESSLGKSCHCSNHAAVPIQVVHDPLGRPHLRLGENRGPAISFSEGGGKIWAALCGDESDIGIDVAETDEFQGEYPVHRVFQVQELQHALRVAGGDLARASALLWSVKEAVAKALGCAFHLVGAAANQRLSGGRGGWRVYLSGGLIQEGSGAVSPQPRPVHLGAFASPGEDVGFHRPLESARSMRRWAAADCAPVPD